jgi:hypothetical protein
MMVHLSFYPIGDNYLGVIAAAAALVLLLAIGPARSKLTRGRYAAILALRLGVIALVLLVMLRPTLVYTTTKKQSATLVLLVDKSRSMSVRDEVDGQSRWDILRRTLDDSRSALRKLAADFELKAYTFDAQTHAAEVAEGKIALGETPDGEQTAIGAALEDVHQQQAEKRLLGMVLMSDGAQRALPPRNEPPPQTASARLKHFGCPIYTIRFGQPRSLGQAADVAVTELVANPEVFVKNELAVAGQIRVDGFVNREVSVQLLVEKTTDSGKPKSVVVDQQTVKAATSGQLIPLAFVYVPEEPGEYKLTLEAAPQPDERVTTNNRISTYVNVLKGGLKVLYVEGAVRVEERFLRQSLDSSPDIRADVVLLDPRRPDDRPADLGERLKPGQYDVYILGDVDRSMWRDGELADLAKAVEEGAGLIMLGGFHSFGAGGYSETPLVDVLPVKMDRLEVQRPGDPIRTDVHLPGPLRMQPTEIGGGEFALRLAATPEASRAIWDKLPPLDGANRFDGLKAGAPVLLATSDGQPLLVRQSYGSGRVLAFAGDSTWHWWLAGFEREHKRLWRQVVLWLAKKDKLAERNVWVRLDQRRVAPGDRVKVTIGARSSTGELVDNVHFDVKVAGPGGRAQPLHTVPAGDHETATFGETRQPGDYTIEVAATKDGRALGSAKARFLVFEQDLELDNAVADAGVMESLAAISGGRSLAPEELPGLLRELGQETTTLEATEAKVTFWDTWPLFLVLVGLLAAEWYLRKRWGLV